MMDGVREVYIMGWLWDGSSGWLMIWEFGESGLAGIVGGNGLLSANKLA